ncbi:MAG: GMC family oxidoreductase [Frankia sp.]|nr:GMC family oxidoreductase [Frankia sp.]
MDVELGSAERYDDVVVGAGSAGAVIAARLAREPGRRVLLVEAGPDHPVEDDTDRLTNPMTFARALSGWGLSATLIPGRDTGYPAGKVVGGGSAVNGALALRGQPEDYDAWVDGWPADAAGSGWDWAGLRPYFVRLEDDADADTTSETAPHGRGGPLPIVRAGKDELLPLQQAFLAAATELGIPWVDDHNDPSTTGIGPFPMNRRGLVRLSTALTYLPAVRASDGLTILAGTRADRVLIEDGRAVGVELTLHGATGPASLAVRATRVTLCAGALQTPALLVRSGIGPADTLREIGVPCVVDNPFVGANLQDHPGTLIHIAPADPALCDPTRPAYQLGIRWSSGLGTPNDLLIGLMNYWDVRADPRLAEAAGEGVRHVFALTCGLHEPRSRGRVTVTSADPAVPPRVDLNLLDDPADEPRLLAGLRLLHRIARSDGMRPAVRDLLLVDDETFADGNDDALRAYLRETLGSWFHACGTARLGPDPRQGAVVGTDLAVHGVSNLYVADASVLPCIPRAAINLTVIAVAEKAADILRAAAS